MRATAPVAIAQAAGKLVVPGVAPAFGRGQALGESFLPLQRRYTAPLMDLLARGQASGEFRTDMPLRLLRPLVLGPMEHILWEAVAQGGARLIVEALELAACGGLHPVKQPVEGVSYAHKIEKAEAAIDWRLPAAVIERRLRAFDPFPGASSVLAGETIKVWRALPCAGSGRPGEVLAVGEAGVEVACGEGALLLTELQRAGGKRLAAADFLRGFPLSAGATFDAPPAGA